MRSKISYIFLIFVLTIGILITNVQAAEDLSFKVTLTPTTVEAKKADEITITFKVSDINMGNEGINTIEGILDYDKNIFEEVNSSAIENLNGWSMTYNDENTNMNGKFLAVKFNGEKNDTDIFKIKLKIKSSIDELTETQIKFKGITSNDGVELVNIGDKIVTVKAGDVKPAESPKPVASPSTKPSTQQSQQVKTIKVTDDSQSVDSTVSTTKYPKAGKNTIIIVAIALVILTAIIFFIRKLNKMK